MDDDTRPQPRGDAATALAAEDLSPYSQDELATRIRLLQLEMARVEQHRDRATVHAAAAHALFARKDVS